MIIMMLMLMMMMIQRIIGRMSYCVPCATVINKTGVSYQSINTFYSGL